MTPGDAAREVASWYGCGGTPTGDTIAEAFAMFAEMLDRSPVFEIRAYGGQHVRYIPASPCGTSCPDAIACPRADDYPEAH